jgi:hypothetical protein
MDRFRIAFCLNLCIAGPLHAGGVVEFIFDSSFEGIEACADFNGVNDPAIVPVIAISGDFTLNGGAFPANEFDDAVISLRDRLTGDVFELGNTHDQSYAANIVPGYYDVIYSVESPGTFVPRNEGAVLIEGQLLLESGTLDIPVTAYNLGGDLLLNGVAFPGNEFDDALIHLHSETAGTLLLGETKFQSYADVPVLPDDYEVRYMLETPGGTVPWNEWGLVGLVTVAGDDPAFDINVVSIEVSGDFRHNGVLMPMVEYDDGNFYLETADGDRAFLENSHFQGYVKQIIPGTYDVYWELETPGNTVPFNPRARVAADQSVNSGTLDIDITSHALSGDIALNGSPFPNTVQHTGRIYLRDQVTGDYNELGLTHETPSYDHQVVEAAYDVIYEHAQGENVPQNEHADVGEILLNKDSVEDIDVPATTFSVPLFHNGMLFTADQGQQANIWLRDVDSDDFALLGRTSQQTVSAFVVPDLYDVYYTHLNGDEIPQNSNAVIYENLLIEIPPVRGGGLEIHVESIPITGQMLLNDAPFPAQEFNDGELRLVRADDSIPLGNTHDQNYSLRIIDLGEPTYYEVFYGVETLGDSVPRNQNARAMCMVLDPDPV